MDDALLFLEKYIFSANIFFTLIIIFIEKRRPVEALFWITTLIFAPYLGFIAFIFLGISLKRHRTIRKYFERKINKSTENIDLQIRGKIGNWKSLIKYLEVSDAGNLSTYSDIRLLSSGSEFFNTLISDIENAKKTIYMEYYLFRNDSIGKRLFDLLIEKAQQGVEIKLIFDGTNPITFRKIKKLRNKGIKIEFFFPPLFRNIKIANLRANYRDHRKITIIDSSIAYIGGFNIGKEYIGQSELGYWRDTAVRLKGTIVNEFIGEFISSWNFIKNESKGTDTISQSTNIEELHPSLGLAQLVSSGPNFQLRTGRDNILKMISEAKKSIFIETPYFVPDDTLLFALQIAATSGINIKIIIPDKPDHFFMYWVNQTFAWDLMEYGVKFYKYKKGFIHSKLMIVDSEIATLGTTNFDYRSFYQNYEININLYEECVVKDLRKIFLQDLKDSKKINIEDLGRRTFFAKFKESVFRLLSPIL